MKAQVRSKVSTYMNRAEELKVHIQNHKELWKVAEKIQIKDNQIGCSYSTLFSKYINDKLSSVRISDSYIRKQHQIYNLLRFCELLVKKGKSFKRIHVLTGHAGQNSRGGESVQQQERLLSRLRSSLGEHGVTMTIEYSETLHDREIIFDNGFVIKMGRGLDYFKGPQDPMSIGFCDYDLRPCLETSVDVYDTR